MKIPKFLSLLLLFLNPNSLRFAASTQVNSIYTDSEIEKAITQNDTYQVKDILFSLQQQTPKSKQLKKYFQIALEGNNSEIISQFIEHEHRLAHVEFDKGGYPIHFATYNLDNTLLERLLRLKVNINSIHYPTGHTALFLAVAHQLHAQIDFLLAHGADTHVHDNSNTGMLAVAAAHADKQLLSQLLQLKGKQQFSQSDIIQGYLRALAVAEREAIKVFHKHDPTLIDAWLDNTFNDEMQVIHVAAQQGTAEVIQILFDEGANINAYTKLQHFTPIYIAAIYKNDATLKKLLELGADPNPSDTKGELGSPLHATCWTEDKLAAKLLLQYGANLHKEYQIWESALSYCRFLKNDNMAEFLLRHVPPPPTKLEKGMQFLKNLFQSHFLWLGAILSFSLYKVHSHYQVVKLLKELQHQESMKKVTLLVNRDKNVLHSLNAVTKPIYPKSVWQAGNYSGLYILQLPKTDVKIQDVSSSAKDQHYTCAIRFDTVHAILFQNLNLPAEYIKSQQNHNTILVELKDKSKFEVTLCQAELLVATIKSALYQACIASDQYQLQKFHHNKQQLLHEFKGLETEIERARAQYAKVIQCSKNNAVLLDETCAKLPLREAAFNKRALKIHETIVRILNQYSEASLQGFKALIEETAKSYHQELLALTQATYQSSFNISETRSKKDRLFATLRAQMINSAQVALSLREHMNELDNTIQVQLSDKAKDVAVVPDVKLTLDEKRRQREQARLDELAAQEQERQAALVRKEQHRLKVLEERRFLEERRKEESERAERVKLALQKRQEEREKLVQSVATSSSSSSSSSSDLQPKLQNKLMNIGDLLQRYHRLQNSNAAITVQYKYALLAECLRLFELTNQFVRSRVANDVRNMLMHQHRFLDIVAICQLAEFIAHTPTEALALRVRKFEDAIDELEQDFTPELKAQLDVTLTSLSVSEFFATYVKPEREKPTVKTYLETMLHLVQDLEKLHAKGDLDLALDADKMFAMNGIFMCFGECYQQLNLLGFAELLVIDGKYTDLIEAFMQFSIRVRALMGHRTHELQENFGHYHRYLNKAASLVEYMQAVVDLLRQNQPEVVSALRM